MTALAHKCVRSYPNNSAIEPFLRVTISSSNLLAAAAGVDELGVLEVRTFSTDPVGSVRLLTRGETVKVTAAGAITQYADVYRAAGGKISATANGKRWGIALEAASGDGSVIEVQYLPAEAQAFLQEAHTADDTLTAAEMYGSIHTSVGASGTITLTLPAAKVGMHAYFKVGAAQELRIDPDGTETIALPSTGVQGAAGKYLTANAAGETVYLVCDTAGTWSVYGFTGTWTAEA